MKNISSVFLYLGILLVLVQPQKSNAAPTREEVLRRNDLRLVVYRDESDKNTFWYVPPVELVQENGKIKYTKRNSKGMVQYNFNVVATMNSTLMEFMSREIPGIKRASQLKPVKIDCSSSYNDPACDLNSGPGESDNGMDPESKYKLGFKFRNDLKNSDQKLVFKDIRYADVTEVTEIPIYITQSANTSGIGSKPESAAMPKVNLSVTAKHTSLNPLQTGITLENGMQLLVTMNYSTQESSQEENLLMAQALYYRVGDSSWIRAVEDASSVQDSRLLIQEDLIESGELEFYLDKAYLWNLFKSSKNSNKTNTKVKSSYDTFNPEFKLTISGKKYKL